MTDPDAARHFKDLSFVHFFIYFFFFFFKEKAGFHELNASEKDFLLIDIRNLPGITTTIPVYVGS